MPVMPEPENRKRTPAYVSYKTFKNAITGLDEVPDAIDYSVYNSMNGSTRTFLFGAFRFLGLIDGNAKPSSEFRALATKDQAQWKATLRSLLEKHYSDQLQALKGGTPATLKKSFGDDVGASVVGPACRFLVAAAKDCDLPVSATIEKGSFGSGGATRRRKAKARDNDAAGDTSSELHSINEITTPPGSVAFPLPLASGREAKLILPRDLTAADLPMLKAGMALADALAQSNSESTGGSE